MLIYAATVGTVILIRVLLSERECTIFLLGGDNNIINILLNTRTKIKTVSAMRKFIGR